MFSSRNSKNFSFEWQKHEQDFGVFKSWNLGFSAKSVNIVGL